MCVYIKYLHVYDVGVGAKVFVKYVVGDGAWVVDVYDVGVGDNVAII